MPWQTDGDRVSVSGHLADLMATIMTAYDRDFPGGALGVSAGEYVMAAAMVLLEILIENLEGNEDATEFLARVSDTLSEDEDGNISIQTFALLADAAEHIDSIALASWLSAPVARAAIRELAATAFG